MPNSVFVFSDKMDLNRLSLSRAWEPSGLEGLEVGNLHSIASLHCTSRGHWVSEI